MRLGLAASFAGCVAVWSSQRLSAFAQQSPPSSAITERRHGSPDESSLLSRDTREAIGVSISRAAKEAITAMNDGFYDKDQGRWSPSVAWWLSGVALQNLLDFMDKNGTRDYMKQAKHIIDEQKKPLPWWPQGNGSFRADSTDDTGWWALALVRMFDLTKEQTYLNISILDEAYMYNYWTTKDCGGGLYVDIKAETYKNAIANELYIKLAASLHNRIPGDTAYLAKAETAWNWFNASGMINGMNLINDGLAEKDGVCFNNALPMWTYNQGVVLGALTELYHATKNQSYIDEARKIADAVVNSGTFNQDGVLTDPCEAEDTCNNDQQIFKGIFAYNLAELSRALSGDPYRDYLWRNAQKAFANDRNSSNFYDVSWDGPFRNSTIAKQSSAVGLLISLL
ncbi:glycoside hydrolase [Podospora didyma]|uniref:Glycoside hydrolase n=1 Tax=Podospora didyma TaxID=330526 RepID=A0AAE0KG18_9PEZI|nr:glycoside hydrolase [Podospora didyma]